MLVVTDGNGNRGHYSALAAANAARGYGIDVYAIGIGNLVNPSQQKVSLRSFIAVFGVAASGSFHALRSVGLFIGRTSRLVLSNWVAK